MLQDKTVEDFLALENNQNKSKDKKTKICQELFIEVKYLLSEDKEKNIELIWLETCEHHGWSHSRVVTQIDAYKRTEKTVSIRIKGEKPPSTLKTLFSTFKKVGDDLLTFDNVKDVVKLANSLREKKTAIEKIMEDIGKLTFDEKVQLDKLYIVEKKLKKDEQK